MLFNNCSPKGHTISGCFEIRTIFSPDFKAYVGVFRYLDTWLPIAQNPDSCSDTVVPHTTSTYYEVNSCNVERSTNSFGSVEHSILNILLNNGKRTQLHRTLIHAESQCCMNPASYNLERQCSMKLDSYNIGFQRSMKLDLYSVGFQCSTKLDSYNVDQCSTNPA